MEIHFKNSSLRRTFESQSALRSQFGQANAELLEERMSNLEIVDNLEEMRILPGRCEELTGKAKGLFSLRLVGGDRLVFQPMGGKESYLRPDGGIDWSKVVSIQIFGVGDYH